MGARSRRLLMVITQEPTQSLTALHGPGAAELCRGGTAGRCPPLMIAFSMVMLDVFAQCAPQGALAKEDYLRQALLLHRPNPAQSTALVSLDRTQTFLVTHVFHPLMDHTRLI